MTSYSPDAQNFSIVRPILSVGVAGWNQAGKVGGGGTVGALQPELARGTGAYLSGVTPLSYQPLPRLSSIPLGQVKSAVRKPMSNLQSEPS